MTVLIEKIRKNKKGASSIETAVIFLVIMIIFSVVFEYASLHTIMNTTRDDAQRVLDSTVVKNAMTVFTSIKNGRSSVLSTQYDYDQVLDQLGLNPKDFTDRLVGPEGMNLVNKNGKYYRTGSGDEGVFVVPPEKFTVDTATADQLYITADIVVGRTIYFMGQRLFDIYVTMNLDTMYTRKNAISAGQEPPTEVEQTGNLLHRNGEQVREVIIPNLDGVPDTVQTPTVSGKIEIN